MNTYPLIGYRFRPTDTQLILNYLHPKVQASPLPSNAITEFDVSVTNPWDLPGHLKENRYFFSRRDSKYSTSFPCGCGHWKAMTGYEMVLAPGNSSIVGMKRRFQFYNANNLGTGWMMAQFHLVGAVRSSAGTNQKTIVLSGDWIVSCVYQIRDRRRSGNRIRTIRGSGTSRRVSVKNMLSDSDDESDYSSDDESTSSNANTGISPSDQLD